MRIIQKILLRQCTPVIVDPEYTKLRLGITFTYNSKNTIKAMYDHATKGVVLLLASSLIDIEDGLINHNPGSLFNWAQQEFGNVALDHSVGDDVFCLIIYK